MPFFANFLVYKYCAQTTNACGWLSEPCAASGGLQIRLRQTPHSTWILTHIDCDKHPTARVFWHTPFRTNTTTAHVFFVDTVDCLNECVSIWLLGWVNCYWVLKSFDEKLLSVVEWWVCGVWGGSFSRTAAIFDWAPLLLKTMAMMIGVKTLNIIPFLFLSTAY